MAGQATLPSGQQDDDIRAWVYHALMSKPGTKEYAGTYTLIVKQLSTCRKQAERSAMGAGANMLTNLIHVMRDYVSLFREHQHESMLAEVLSVKLWTAAPTLRGAVLDLVSSLVVVNTAFTHTCLRLLVASLLPAPAPVSPEATLGTWEPSEDQVMVQAAITGTLVKVLGLVPMAPVSLMQLVGSHMPHKLRDRNTQCLFLSAVFSLAEAPAGRPVRDALLAVTVEHLLALDVDIKWEDIVEVPSAEAAEEHADSEDPDDIFQLEGMHELDLNATPEQLEQARQERLQQQAAQAGVTRGGWEGAAAGTAAAAAAAPPQVDETANKLDSLMELTFAHLERRCNLPGAGGPAPAWSALMACFERTILNTHRSKFSQFLVFFMCIKHPDPCVRMFAEFLLSRLQDAHLPPITRSACAAYLASFLARCAAAPSTLVLQCLDALTRFAQQYAAAADTGSGANGRAGTAVGGDQASCLTTKHQVFYASIQAILYILCYHLDTLMTHQHQHHHRQTLAEACRALLSTRVLPLLAHPLRPLRVCLPSVVAEFNTQLLAHGFTDLGQLLATTPDVPGAVGQRPLEMFFPFDPYLLQRSSRYLDLPTSYVRWRKGAARGRVNAGLSESDERQEGEEEDEEEEVSVTTAKQALIMDEEDDEDGELELDTSSSSTDGDDDDGDSSSDLEDGSLRDGSIASGSVSAMRPHSGLPPRGGPHHWGGRFAPGHPRGSSKRGGHSVCRSPNMMATSYDPMVLGTSYGTGGFSPAGTSPEMVNYCSGHHGSGPQGQSVSPMNMTPQPLSHMMRLHPVEEVMPGRLAART